MLLQGQTSRGRDSKLTLGETCCETVLPAETEDLSEVVNLGGEVLAKDENVVHIEKTKG